MTVSDIEAVTRLNDVAVAAGAQRVLALLNYASQPTDIRQFVGIPVSYLAQRGRLEILREWATDSTMAAELLVLGASAWADSELLHRLRPVGEEHVVGRQLHEYTSSHYLVAMTAARRALSFDPADEPFVERLRLLLVIRALEAAEQGIVSEHNLAEVCLTVRQISESQEHGKWPWIKHLAHRTTGFDDFVSETRFLLKKAKGSAQAGPRHVFYRHLQSVLDKKRRARKDNLISRVTAHAPANSKRVPTPALPALSVRTDIFQTGEIHVVQDDDESVGFAAVEVDATRPAPAQREQGTGIVLQALEEAQYLRHSWHRLSQPEEQQLLKRALDLMQEQQSAIDRLGAALCIVALLTSRPLSGLVGMSIQSPSSEDWALDWRDGSLHRQPPRFARRWNASDARASRWVRSLAIAWRIALSPVVLSALRQGSGAVRPKTVADLWGRLSANEPLHLWFSRRFADTDLLERLTAPIVPPAIAQRIYEHAGDHVLARLVSSSTRSGLPSACTYGAFTAREIRGALGDAIAPELGQLIEPAQDSQDNASGSELDVHVERMADVIGQMTARVDGVARSPEQWVEHHNRLTALCVVALLASTGARPVSSPFESLDWFDFERGHVYVEDKRSGPTRGSRLCVLSDFASQLLRDHYLPHLMMLASSWERSGPSPTADEIKKLASGNSDCRLPLFFLLRAEPTLDWIEVSESQLSAVCNDPWPLPWNVFRHLHATQLRRWGLDPEIRDALLSHGDRGAESHGDFSWRVPLHDLSSARPFVNRLAGTLGFKLPSRQEAHPAMAKPRPTELELSHAKPFGRAARALRRQASHEAARRTAVADIEHQVGARPPSSLSEQLWDDIARSMVLRQDGLPHPMASLRYEAFEAYRATLWHTQGVQAKLPSVRYIPLPEGASIFSQDVIGASQRLAAFAKRFDATVAAQSLAKPRRPALAACLASIELVLHCRVGHFAVLAAVACNSSAIKVVRFNACHWLEWAYRGDWRDGRPVYRVPTTDCAAGWIAVAQESRKRLTEIPDTPLALHGLLGDKPADFGLRLKELAAWTAQANYLDSPGAMAAFLNGERETAALPHHDWIRTIHVAAPQVGPGDAHAPEPATQAPATYFAAHHRAVSGSGKDAPRCRQLFDEIQKILSADRMRDAATTLGESIEAGATLKRKGSAIGRAVRTCGFGHGDAPFVMAHYAYHLLCRPKQAGAAGSLRASTALRYWESLKPGFLDFAFDVHLPDLDEDELTELYGKIVNAARPADSDNSNLEMPGHARRRKLKDDSDAGQRAVSELVAFHEFARELYGLEDPDWSEIAPGKAVGHGRPGIVLLAEYTAALQALVPQGGVEALDDDSLGAAFVLFACARFGLRGGEAVGLQRRDWVQIAGSVVVLIRSSHIRSLKNLRSKRQVPLIGTLSALEQALVDETLRRWELRQGVDRKAPLLPGITPNSFKGQQRWISVRLLALIKSITGNPASTIHHLRHGFACRLMSMLCGGPIGIGLQFASSEAEEARKLLMSTTEAGRRSLWAVARMLGHASPATTLKAYAHVMDAWLPAPPERPSAMVFAGTRRVIDLDSLPRDASYLKQLIVLPSPPPPTGTLWLRALQYLRLRGLGNANAGWATRLTAGQIDRVEATLELASQRLHVMPAKERTAQGLLAGIRPARWDALVDLVKSAPDPAPNQPSPDWIGTIGANRHVVLFLPEHFGWAGEFLRALELTPNDCKLAQDRDSQSHLERGLAAAGLFPYVMAKAEYAKSFQIDRAIVGSPERTYTHRMALVPAPSERVRDTIELMMLWLSWLSCFAVSTANTDADQATGVTIL